MQELLNETLGRAVCVEAAGIATEKEITLEEALQEIREGIGLSRAQEPSDWDRQPAEDRTQGRRQHQTDEPTAIRAIRRESSQYVSEPYLLAGHGSLFVGLNTRRLHSALVVRCESYLQIDATESNLLGRPTALIEA